MLPAFILCVYFGKKKKLIFSLSVAEEGSSQFYSIFFHAGNKKLWQRTKKMKSFSIIFALSHTTIAVEEEEEEFANRIIFFFCSPECCGTDNRNSGNKIFYFNKGAFYENYRRKKLKLILFVTRSRSVRCWNFNWGRLREFILANLHAGSDRCERKGDEMMEKLALFVPTLAKGKWLCLLYPASVSEW